MSTANLPTGDTKVDSKHLKHVTDHLMQSAETKQLFAAEAGEQIASVATVIAGSLQSGGKVMLCGNGGSAADCQHIAAEFVSLLNQDFPRPALPAFALTTDSSFLTARANDFGFDEVFARQVEAFGQLDDVLIGITTSGNSRNVIAAAEAAKSLGMATVGLTGGNGGKMKETFDHVLCVPSDSVQYIQECHIAVGHILVAIIESILFEQRASN